MTTRERRLLRRSAADMIFIAGTALQEHPHDPDAVRDALAVLRTADPQALRRLNRLLLDDMRSGQFDRHHHPKARRNLADVLYRIYRTIDVIDANPAAIAQRIAA